MTRTYDEAAEAVFDQASQLIKDLPKTVKVTDTQKLRFYGLLQQATQGDCTLPQPRVQEVKNRAKWNAWSQCGSMTPTIAKRHYVEFAIEVLRDAAPDQAQSLRTQIESLTREDSIAQALPGPGGVAPTTLGGSAVGPLSFSTPRRDGVHPSLAGQSSELLHSESVVERASETDDEVAEVATNPSTAEVLATLQAELNNTTNRVRELEFHSRAAAPIAQPTAFTPTQLALVLLWPVAVQVGWSLLRPRRQTGR